MKKADPVQPKKKENAMAKDDKPVEVENISCEMCLKEVPLSEAVSTEGTDYFAYFCGLECYEAWKAQKEKTPERK
jgi:hypothetical protein